MAKKKVAVKKKVAGMPMDREDMATKMPPARMPKAKMPPPTKTDKGPTRKRKKG